jgi:hypothetical protein
MSAEEEVCAVSRIVGGIANNSRHAIGAARFERLKVALACAAEAKTMLNGGVVIDRRAVVNSPLIDRMVDAYSIASTGKILVVCTPVDTGKTSAARFLMHGKHPFRPDRSLMVSATSMKDFPVDYTRDVLGVEKQAGPVLGQILCRALTSAETTEGHAFTESAEISMYGPDQILGPADFKGLPMLIVDNFNEATDKNEDFVKKLLQEASLSRVFVFILTSDKEWATTLVGLNGGCKIKPLYGNVDNKDYKKSKQFLGDPEWNTMPWTVETLRALIQPLCVNPVELVPDGAKMLPVEAIDAASEARRDAQLKALLLVVPAAIVNFNDKGRDATKLMKNEMVALLLSCYGVDTAAALRREEMPFFVAKLQEQIDSDKAKIPAALDTNTGTAATAS